MTETNLAVAQRNALAALAPESRLAERQFSAEQMSLLQNTICKDHTADEIKLFLAYCNSKGLDPFSQEIFSVKRGGKLTFQIGIPSLRSRAESTGEYDGQETYWCGKDGRWVDVWLHPEPPVAAKAIVYRKGAARPFSAIALWNEYKPESNDWMWRKMPSNQLAKCAEALALKKAFPSKLGGLYTHDEMRQADNGKSSMHTVQMPREKIIEAKNLEPTTSPGLGSDDAIEPFPPPDSSTASGQASSPEAPSSAADDAPSEGLLKHFRATLRERALVEKVKSWCQMKYGKTSSKSLTETEIREILDAVDQGIIH